MKKLTVSVANLGIGVLENHRMTRMAGLTFTGAPSVFPAVTCAAQAALRTGLRPQETGCVANGFWCGDLNKPLFWEQNAGLVKGKRVWSDRRAAGGKVGLFFFQQSLGEEADVIVSPAPIHKHGGGMLMSCYTRPNGTASLLEKANGTFPLWRYWGPLASPKVGRDCIDWFESMTDVHDVDEAYLYLPTLDYAAQKHGPYHWTASLALREFRRQLERLADICQKRGAELSVVGEYDISAVTEPPLQPNATLRQAGLFKVRTVRGRAYPDFYASTAFAICDHEICLIHGADAARAVDLLLSSGDYEQSRIPNLLLAKPGSWCDYKWWTDRREAPDYASHVDIHNKPGYDPTELFFFGRGTVKGTHGRTCTVAQSENT